MTLQQLQARVAVNVLRTRRSLGLTAGAVAEAARISPDTLRLIEYGRANATLSVLVALAAALGVEPADLFAQTDG